MTCESDAADRVIVHLHFDVMEYEWRGKKFTRFTERPKRGGGYKRGAQPMTYRYSHSAGNIVMQHPKLWAAREIMAQTESGRKYGAVPAVYNNPVAAMRVVLRHYRRYKP